MNEEQLISWKKEMDIVINSKAEEWQLLGYEQVTKDDVWNCFVSKLPRLEVPDPVRPHWIASELLRMKVNDYMNLLTVQAYKGPSWFEGEEPISFSLPNKREESSLS